MSLAHAAWPSRALVSVQDIGTMHKTILRAFTGELLDTTNHKDKVLAAIGALCAIYAVSTVSAGLGEGATQGFVLASMGASAVLLFAVPHGALAQPWPVVGGHLTGAIAGVTANLLISDAVLASAVAVATSIAAMHYLRCIHPPAGATALFAVLGGDAIHALGYGFLLHPVLSNVAVMLAIAVVFNYSFPWRRYPAALHRPREDDAEPEDELSADDLEHAMREMNLHMDITEEDLARLYHLAKRHHESTSNLREDEIENDAYYSNGRVGAEWSVRKIIEPRDARNRDTVHYLVVAGDGLGSFGSCSRSEFAEWACHRIKATQRFHDHVLKPYAAEAGAA